MFKTSKGAPHVLLKLLPESDSLTHEAVERDVRQLGEKGIRCLAVAKTNPLGEFLIHLIFIFMDSKCFVLFCML